MSSSETTSGKNTLTGIYITLMMEAVSTSETTVNFYQTTWCNIPEE
jgi:hypothetical protein